MLHNDVYLCFKVHLPQLSKNVVDWFQNGRNSIRVRMDYMQDYIFTYCSEHDWCLETIDSYIKKMKGGGLVKC